jgi:CRP-like cAMP-binding protein
MQRLLSLYNGTDISTADLLFIMSKVERLFVKKGQLIGVPGEVCEQMFVIESGLFRCYMEEDGKEYTLFFRQEGEILTDFRSFIRKEPAQLFMQALEDAELYRLHASHLQEIYARVPAMGQFNHQTLQNYYVRLLDSFTNLFAGDAKRRFIRFAEHHADILQRVPQHMIANYLRITPTHLSRLKRQQIK